MRLFALFICVILASFLSSFAAAQSVDSIPYAPKTVGILLFQGVQVIDFSGPYEVLNQAHVKGGPLFKVVTVAANEDMLKTSPRAQGLNIKSDFSFENCPKLDILLIPGGNIENVTKDPKSMAWIASAIDKAECVMSVCNGALILASGHQLKGLKATTFHGMLNNLAEIEPTCTVVYDQRFVDNGKIITTAGLSSGLDGALHLIERYGGRFTAEQAALGLEYNWQPDKPYTRTNFADRFYFKAVKYKGFDFADGDFSDWTVVANNGSDTEWTRTVIFNSTIGADKIWAVVDKSFDAVWKRISKGKWIFTDEKGRPWGATADLRSTDKNQYSLEIKLKMK